MDSRVGLGVKLEIASHDTLQLLAPFDLHQTAT